MPKLNDTPGVGVPAPSLTDEQAEALIEASDGHWKEDVFCIGGPELMALLRAAAGVAGTSRVGTVASRAPDIRGVDEMDVPAGVAIPSGGEK